MLGKIYFTGDDVYDNFLAFAPILSCPNWIAIKKAANWISTGISFKKVKPFDTNLELTMSNLAMEK